MILKVAIAPSPPFMSILEELLDEIEVEEENREIMRKIFIINTGFLQLLSQRDEVAAEIIIHQEGNGLITFGFAHKQGIQQHLIAHCQSE